jgi:hypothetical protein
VISAALGYLGKNGTTLQVKSSVKSIIYEVDSQSSDKSLEHAILMEGGIFFAHS